MIENDRIRAEFCRILEQRLDIGTGRMIANWFFEPSNIFDPNARRAPKPGLVIVASYMLLVAAAWAVFNFQ